MLLALYPIDFYENHHVSLLTWPLFMAKITIFLGKKHIFFIVFSGTRTSHILWNIHWVSMAVTHLCSVQLGREFRARSLVWWAFFGNTNICVFLMYRKCVRDIYIYMYICTTWNNIIFTIIALYYEIYCISVITWKNMI